MSKQKYSKQTLSRFEGWGSILLNIALFGLKYWAGLVSGSIALIADAWHTLSDSISSIFILVGTKVSAKPPDERHPFGHGRAELITAILIGFFLAVVAYEFFIKSIARLKSTDQSILGPTVIFILIISILAKEGLAQFAFWAYRQTGSDALRADGWHHRTDSLSSVLVLIGIVIGRQWVWIDGLLGIIVALFIFYAAFEIIRDAVDPLMGRIPRKDEIDKIKKLCIEISSFPIQAHHFHIHQYGDHTELTFHIVFPPDHTLKDAHDLTNSIELEIRKRFKIEATIHMEPKGEEHDYYPEISQNI